MAIWTPEIDSRCAIPDQRIARLVVGRDLPLVAGDERGRDRPRIAGHLALDPSRQPGAGVVEPRRGTGRRRCRPGDDRRPERIAGRADLGEPQGTREVVAAGIARPLRRQEHRAQLDLRAGYQPRRHGARLQAEADVRRQAGVVGRELETELAASGADLDRLDRPGDVALVPVAEDGAGDVVGPVGGDADAERDEHPRPDEQPPGRAARQQADGPDAPRGGDHRQPLAAPRQHEVEDDAQPERRGRPQRHLRAFGEEEVFDGGRPAGDAPRRPADAGLSRSRHSLRSGWQRLDPLC